MKPVLKRVLVGGGCVVGALAVAVAGFVYSQVSAFDQSMEKVYAQAPLPIARSENPAMIARGKHLVDAVAGCSSRDCHGSDLGGGKPLEMGPVGTLSGPNITSGGLLPAYKDGELARLIRYGIKRDGRSATFMPSGDFNWLNDDDLVALVSYLRTVPKVDRPNGPVAVGPLGKILDRRGRLLLDVGRAIASRPLELAGAPTPTVEYGKHLARMCTGCHGEHLSGGRIPGAPGSLPVPLNLTPDSSGLAGWTYEDFDKLIVKGDRKNGKKLDPFMPVENFGQMDEVEKRALYLYLMSLSPLPMGGR